jgi:hypothetical protein
MRRIRLYAFVNLIVLFAFMWGSFTSIDAGTLTLDFLKVQATNELGSGQFTVDVGQAEQNNDVWSWFLDAPVELFNSNNEVIATLDSAAVTYVADPQIALNFVVSAGAANTHFTITSATLGFPALNPAEGRASAGITVTDNTGDGTSLTGNIDGGKSYRAMYDGGTVFADLVNDDSTSVGFGTITSSEANPASGFAPIAGGLDSMASEFGFTIPAGDSASGTSIFVTQIPEPSSLVMILFGCLLLARGVRSSQ